MNKEVARINNYYRIAISVLLVVMFYYIAAVIKPSLFLHAQQSPFLNTKEYFASFLFSPGGITQYLSHLLMQGLYNNLLGSLLILLIISGNALLFNILLRKVFNQNLIFFPIVFMLLSLAMIQNYFFPIVVIVQSLFVIIALVILLSFSLTNLFGWIKYLFIYIFLYCIVGSGAALVFALGSIILFIISFPIRVYYKLIAIIISAALLPYLAYKSIFNISLPDAYLNFFPDLSITVKYVVQNYFYFYVFLIPILLLFIWILKGLYNKLSSSIKKVLISKPIRISLILLTGLGAFFFVKATEDELGRAIVLCDYYNYKGEFDKTIELALSSAEEYNISINIAYNRAIANKDELPDRFLDYPQYLGSQIIQPDKLRSPIYIMAASDHYFDLGYISEAQHFAYAILAINPDNPRAKKRLVETNILMGNLKAANTYLKSLANNPHTKDFVNKHMAFVLNPELVSLDPLLSGKLELMPENFAIPVLMKERLKDLLKKNDSNKMAYEYLQLANILDHQLNSFIEELNGSLKFYNKIPRLYEQALIMYYYNTEQTGLESFSISKSAIEQFSGFLRIMAQSGNNKDLAKEKLDAYSKSYMYYVTYLSPKVTDIQVIQSPY